MSATKRHEAATVAGNSKGSSNHMWVITAPTMSRKRPTAAWSQVKVGCREARDVLVLENGCFEIAQREGYEQETHLTPQARHKAQYGSQ